MSCLFCNCISFARLKIDQFRNNLSTNLHVQPYMKRIHPIILAVIGVPVATVSIMVLDLSVTKSVHKKKTFSLEKTIANSLYNLHVF